jgi:3-isopropylmalate/(R)-2-methylmalate dehydratase small subunit
MLPIILDEEKIQQLSQYSERKKEIEINLKEQRIMFGNSIIKFELDSFKKECLLNGLDDIALTLEKSDKISKYENKFKKNKPWIN